MKIRVLVAALASVAVVTTGAAGARTAKKPPPFRILVSNDDGVRAPGIDALVQGLRHQKNVEVTVVAPLKNQSGTGGKTTAGPLTASHTTTKSGYPAIAVDGFPADSVDYALHKVVHPADVDLMIAGINQGANLGPFVDLSGTVGAARAAAQAGIPALATSEGTLTTTNFAAGVASTIAWFKANRGHLKRGSIENLNIPECSAGHVRGTAHVTSDRSLPPGANPFATVDCTQTAGPATDDVGAYLQGFATLATIPKKPAAAPVS